MNEARKWICGGIVALFVLATASPKQPPTGPAARVAGTETPRRMPVKRVVLYKNGVGYFEHTVRVSGNEDLGIDFTSAQLNDVLKSLTVVDLGEGRITGVRYNSVAPLSERLKALRLPLGDDVSRADFLGALRGARVEVRSSSAAAAGRVLSVERVKRQTLRGDLLTEVTELSIVSDSGELRSFELGPGTVVRIAERDLTEEVGRYLNLVGSTRAKDVRRMTINTSGAGEREVFVSYISEVPVWKSTYRILLPTKHSARPTLQGWAIVDNTIGEDWKEVQLTLVAGAPQSFIQEMSQPYYARRPVVALPEFAMLSPQTHEGTMAAAPPPPSNAPGPRTTSLQGEVKDPTESVIPGARVTVRNEETGTSQTTRTDLKGYYRFDNIPAGNSALFVQAPGFRTFSLTNVYLGVGRTNEVDAALEVGAVSQTVEVQASAAPFNTMVSSMARTFSRVQPEAEGKGLGDFFQYELKQKVTIGKDQSALVPILQGDVEAEKVTLWTQSAGPPLRALWIKNTSGLTLDGGSLEVLEEGAFAGEGLLDTLRPGEKRLISYAADPAVRVTVQEESSERPVSRVKIAKGLMVLTREERKTTKYKLRNADIAPRDVIIEHRAEEGWELAKGLKPEESSASFHRFRVSVEPAKNTELLVEESHPDETEIALTNLTSDEVALLVNEKRITPEMEQAFQKLLAMKSEISNLDSQLKSREEEVASISSDQARLRENLKALKGSPEEKALIQRYTRQLDSQEDRLAVLRTEISGLKEKHDSAKKELDQTLLAITLDQTF